MALCEKCWRDSHGDSERYLDLLAERTGTDRECTPEEQAGGENAKACLVCGRKTVHAITGECVNPRCLVEKV
jgi:hypothetical protein